MYFVSYDKITKAVLTLHSLPNIGVCAFVYVCVCVSVHVIVFWGVNNQLTITIA